LIKADFIKDLDLPILGKISIRGVFGEPVVAELVSLKVKPYQVQTSPCWLILITDCYQ